MPNSLKIRFLHSGATTQVELLHPLELDGFTVPAGFISDGCSIPRLGWTLIGHPFHHRYLKEAIGHDYLYKTGMMTRRSADLWFFHHLKKPWLRIRRYIIYGAVRAFGWLSYYTHKRARNA